MPICIVALLLCNFNKLQNTEWKLRVGSIYDELKYTSKWSLMYFALFILRRLVFALAAVLWSNFVVF